MDDGFEDFFADDFFVAARFFVAFFLVNGFFVAAFFVAAFFGTDFFLVPLDFFTDGLADFLLAFLDVFLAAFLAVLFAVPPDPNAESHPLLYLSFVPTRTMAINRFRIQPCEVIQQRGIMRHAADLLKGRLQSTLALNVLLLHSLAKIFTSVRRIAAQRTTHTAVGVFRSSDSAARSADRMATKNHPHRHRQQHRSE